MGECRTESHDPDHHTQRKGLGAGYLRHDVSQGAAESYAVDGIRNVRCPDYAGARPSADGVVPEPDRPSIKTPGRSPNARAILASWTTLTWISPRSTCPM